MKYIIVGPKEDTKKKLSKRPIFKEFKFLKVELGNNYKIEEISECPCLLSW